MQVNPPIVTGSSLIGASVQAGKTAITKEEQCPFTGETFAAGAPVEAGACPYLAAKKKLEAAAKIAKETPPAETLKEVAESTAKTVALGSQPSPPLIGVAKSLGLEFRKEGRGIDFWRTKFKPISPEKAIELASVYKTFEARSAEGDWNPVDSIEELKAVIHAADKEAKKQALMATGNATAQMVTDQMVGLPVSLGTQEMTGPTPVGAPASVGLLSFARGIGRHYGSPLQFLQEFHAKMGRSFEVNTPTHGNFLFDTRTDVIMDALKETDGGDETFKKSELQGHGAAFLIGKENMFTSNGADWAVVQTALRGHMTAKKINSPEMMTKLTGIFDDHFSDLKAKAQAAPDGIIEIDSRAAMQTAVLDVAFQVFFSTKLPKKELLEFQDAFNTQMSWLPQETVNPTDISLSNLPGMGKLRKAYATLDGLAEKMLQERRANPDKPGDVLDSFMDAKDPQTGEPLSDERIKHEVLSLLEAGHETTATMMGWSLMMMSRNPDEYKALQAEVDTVVGTDAPGPEVRGLDRATAVINETLRMYPPFYLFMRQAKEDVTIGAPGNQVNVKKGTTLVSSLYETNRDEQTWGEEKTGFPAHEFHSARFDEKNSEKFIPFGAGKRSCIGQNLGRLEGNVMLARLAQEFDIVPADNKDDTIELHSDLSIHPKDGTVRLKLRENKPTETPAEANAAVAAANAAGTKSA